MVSLSEIKSGKRDFNFIQRKKEGTFDTQRLPSGIFTLDYITAGGLPINQTSSIFGPWGGGKTLLSLLYVANAQYLCWNCFKYLWDCNCNEQTIKKPVFVSVEGFDSEDWEFAESVGVDTDNLEVLEPETGEMAVDAVYACMNADDCCGVVLDSIANVIPESEITDSAINLKVGDRSKLHARLMHKVKASCLHNKKINNNKFFLALNQVRAKIGGHGPQTEDAAGGFTTQHDWTLAIRQSQIRTEAEFIDKTTEMPLVGKFKSSLVSPASKRKLFTLAGSGEYYIALKDGNYPKGSVPDQNTVIKRANDYGLIDKKKWQVADDEMSFKTKAEMTAYWNQNPQYYLSIKRKIISKCIEIEKGQVQAGKPVESVDEEGEEYETN